MLRTFAAFVPVALVLSLAPGAATALVVRNAARGGRRHAFLTTAGNSLVLRGAPALPSALLMAGTIVVVDLVWYSLLAYLVARAKRAFVEGPWLRRFERLTGIVLVGLGVRLALERR